MGVTVIDSLVGDDADLTEVPVGATATVQPREKSLEKRQYHGLLQPGQSYQR